MTEEMIRDALRDCYDPELPCNIVDLGLVQQICVIRDDDAPGAGIVGVPARFLVDVTLILRDGSDDAQTLLVAQVGNRLAGLESVSRSTVAVASIPPWTPQRITAAGRRTLRLDGNPALVQIGG